MKVLVVLTGLISLALSEAPYAPSGWKPSGALLVLPSRQQQFNQGNPQPSGFESQLSRQQQLPAAYGPPAQPDNTNQGEATENGNNGVAPAGQGEAGAYYVLLPDGRLQKIQYTASTQNPQDGQAINPQTSNAQNQNAFGQLTTPNQQFQSGNINSNQFQPGQYQAQRQSAFNQQSFQNERFSQSQENLGFGQATNNVNTFQRFNNNDQNRQQNAFPTQQNSARTAATPNFQANPQQSEKSASAQSNQENQEKTAKLVAQFSEAQLKANGPLPDSYVASVQFSDVPPITAPVYVFNSAPLVRVLRMAA